MIKTNTDLVAALQNVASKYKTVYMWGVFGSPVTEAIIAAKVKQYPSWYTAAIQSSLRALIGKGYFAFDCVNLIKGLLWDWNGDASKSNGGAAYNTNGVPDTNADGMIALCKDVSTDFSKIVVGEAVWLAGHIGIYIGGGKAIECTPSWSNCVQTTAVANIGTISGLNARAWTKHGKLPYITYENSATTSTPTQAQTQTPAPSTQGDIVAISVKHAAEIIYANEGNYGSVNKNDNGALSIGKVQWHGSRALSLMQTIVKANLAQAQTLLGATLYNEILNAKSDAWNARVVTADEAAKISSLLTTTAGKSAQDALANSDITTYVNKGMSYGLKDCGALIYFADGVNQYGTNSALWKTISESALKATGDVTAMFNATKAQTQNYLDRREKVYKAVLALNLVSITQDTRTANEITVDNAIADGVLTDRLHWLGVLSGTIKPVPEYIKIALDRYHAKML